MILYFPNRLSMLSKSNLTLSINKIPNFNTPIPTGSCQKACPRMEANPSNPILMAFPGHNKISRRNWPQFPRGIIRASSQYVFLLVVIQRCHAHQVTLYRFYIAHVSVYPFKFFQNPRILGILLPDCRLLAGYWLLWFLI